MANSLETRVPFIDYRLIEFIESLPPGLKLKGLTGKYLHKKAVEKWLPREVVYRKKKGFANPVEEWFRTAMRPYIEDCLLASDLPAGKYFDQRYISLSWKGTVPAGSSCAAISTCWFPLYCGTGPISS